jgi:GTP-dependent phosphoenolpyruvate carboxykinase
MAFEELRRGLVQERQEQRVGLGELERALQRPVGGARVTASRAMASSKSAITSRNVDGLFVDLAELLHVDPAEWRSEIAPIRELYASLGDSLPAELQDQLTALDRRLS